MIDLPRALNISYKILEHQALSEKSLRERLTQKSVQPQAIESVIAKLKKEGLLSDSALAENMAQSRVKNRLLANRRVCEDLLQRGIPLEVVRKAVREAAEDIESPTEEERAFQLARKRAAQMSAQNPAALKRRIFDYLARRGFDPDTIQAALERYGGCGEKK